MLFPTFKAPAAFAALGTGLIAAYVLVGHTRGVGAGLYLAAAWLSVAAVVVGLRHRLRHGAPLWRLFSIAVVLYALGDLAWCLHDIFGVALPSHLSDAGYLASYPFFAVALVLFSAGRRELWETVARQLVDAALLFVSVYCAVWFLAIDPIVDRGDLSFQEMSLSIAYPTLDLVLLALVTRFAFSSGRWPLSYRLVGAAFASMFVGDLVWRMLLAGGGYQVDSWINTLFMAGYILWGAAALHPSVEEVEQFGIDASSIEPATAWRRLSLLGVAAVVPAIVLVVSRNRIDDLTDVILFALVIVLLPALSLTGIADVLRALRRSVADFDEIVRNSPAPTCVIDHDGTVLMWNSAAERTSGYGSAEVVGGTAPIIPADDPERVAKIYSEALRGITQSHVEVKLLHRDGHPIDVRVSTAPLHDGRGRIVALFEDVTSERAQQAEIAFLAEHDPLTGLPNRRQFERELESATVAASTTGEVHLALFDIDGFKLLNDSGGHTIGDRILRELSALLSETVRPEDFLARLSGDEFALILNTFHRGEAATIVQRLVDIARDYRLRTQEATFDVTLSAGLYTLASGDSGETALRRADEALYRAKALGKNRLERWAHDPHRGNAERRAWSPIIKDALRDGRLDAYLQPIVALRSGEIAFYEVLCRLRAVDGTVFAAGEWIDHAEHLGLMPAIDSLMLQQAGDLVRDTPELCLFVNISASSFHDDTVITRLEEQLATTPYGSLGIEITEHTTLSDPDRTRETLTRLEHAGALIAIDDFGLGFTSFTELAYLPCDIVKIPGSFADTESSTTPGGAVIAQAITQVAHHYGKSVIIEGVETAATARWATLLGIEYGQGWHFGRPAADTIACDAWSTVAATAGA